MNKQEVMALFVDDVHLAPHEDWTISLPNYERKYGEISWYDDLYVERYEDFSLNRIDKEADSSVLEILSQETQKNIEHLSQNVWTMGTSPSLSTGN